MNEPKDDADLPETQPSVSARSVAALAVVRVLRDGAFAAAALSAELDRAIVLQERDRALATELLYARCTRPRALPEARLKRRSRRAV